MSQPAWSQTILNLARAIKELAEARERLRIASMIGEKHQCETLIRQLLDDMQTMVIQTPPQSTNAAP